MVKADVSGKFPSVVDDSVSEFVVLDSVTTDDISDGDTSVAGRDVSGLTVDSDGTGELSDLNSEVDCSVDPSVIVDSEVNDELAVISDVTSVVGISEDVSVVETSVGGWVVSGLIVDSEGSGELSDLNSEVNVSVDPFVEEVSVMVSTVVSLVAEELSVFTTVTSLDVDIWVGKLLVVDLGTKEDNSDVMCDKDDSVCLSEVDCEVTGSVDNSDVSREVAVVSGSGVCDPDEIASDVDSVAGSDVKELVVVSGDPGVLSVVISDPVVISVVNSGTKLSVGLVEVSVVIGFVSDAVVASVALVVVTSDMVTEKN